MSDRREYLRNWRATHREQINAYNREYYANHKEKRNAERREYRHRHPEVPAAQSKRYREAHLDKKRAHSVVWYRVPHWEGCMFCGAKKDLQEHHPNYEEKDVTITLCRSCHNDLHNGKLILEEVKT